ncbi:MAG: DUF202 domain-containing protein [Candidatus Abyssobacteria bacterium SURF_5]|uniref:DUF202 domain-containing protein n=1 Tax=Abyssobacteria bacterium (strain SURF_5) TaxID=2093360 RepID=A0A3A4P3Q5_ABYX5|nr:MAG: DUF202 domain-containing protein [Candidatus Abyssubacteria bacterium SURF_5]
MKTAAKKQPSPASELSAGWAGSATATRQEGNILNENQYEQADERTDLARKRNALANERTFSAWVRTALAAVAAGVGIAKLIPTVRAEWLTVVIGALFILGGIILFLLSIVRYHATESELQLRDSRQISLWTLGLIIFLFLAGSVLSLLLLWM